MSAVRYHTGSPKQKLVYFACAKALAFVRLLLSIFLFSIPLTVTADFNRAAQNFAAERYVPALQEFTQLAELGHAGSQFNLGAMHFLGQGVAQNNIEAYAWIALAAENADATAKSLRTRLWNRFDDNEREQAQQRFNELQENFGNEILQQSLWPLIKETAPEKHLADSAQSLNNKAPEYPRRALNLRIEGAVDIEYSLDPQGYVTDFAVIASTDKIFNAPTLEAVQYWRFAPSVIDNEPVVEQTDKQADDQPGAQTGEQTAAPIIAQQRRVQFRLESAMKREGTADFLQEQALDELRQQAEAGEPLDMFNYAYNGMLEHEHTLSAAEANSWYLKAAQAGLPQAQYQLGRNLLYGIGCERDPVKARHWLTFAAADGMAQAQYFLALMILNAEAEEAMAWLDRAVAAQLPVAIVKKAWLLATHTDDRWLAGEQALKLIKRRLKHYPDTLMARRTLAASQAASGNFEAAVVTQQEVIRLAKKFSRPLEIEEQRLSAYREQKIWRE